MQKYIHNTSDDKFDVEMRQGEGLGGVGVGIEGLSVFQQVKKVLIDKVAFEQRHEVSKILILLAI